MSNYIISISDQIRFNENLYSNQHSAIIQDTLAFDQAIAYHPIKEIITDRLNFSQDITYGFTSRTYTITDQLNFQQKVARAHSYYIQDSFTFSQEINPPKFNSLNQQLLFYSTLSYNRNNLSLRDVLTFNQFFGYSILKPKISMQSQMHCDPIPLDHIQFGNVILRSPNLGNKDNYQRSRIDTKTRGNELLIGGPDFWPRNRTINFDFDTLTLPEITDLLNYLKRNVGKSIAITDHEGNSFSVIAMSASPEIKQVRDGDCSYSTSLELYIL